jgi:hypothetical protein
MPGGRLVDARRGAALQRVCGYRISGRGSGSVGEVACIEGVELGQG